MELSSGEQKAKESKGKKIVLISLGFVFALIILTIVAILLLQKSENDKFKMVVDSKSANISKDIMIKDPDTGERFFCINDMAKLVGYSFYNGWYKQYSEDKTKCYTECADEIAMLELNSDVVYKNRDKNKQNFDAYKIDKPVTSYNGELYISETAAQMVFNTQFVYTSSNNTVSLYTLPYLVNYYKTLFEDSKYGFSDISEDFATQKALTKNMLVVSKDEKYGVVNASNLETIIGNKYDSITYIENTNEFIVTSDKKTGTLSEDGQIRIGLRYDEVGLIDGEARLYYAKNDKMYGVLNQNGRVLVYVQYDEIGVNRKLFPLVNLQNDILLFNNCIPLKKGNKWGIADKNGNIILNFEYDNLGYVENIPIDDDDENKVQGNSTTVKANDRSINNAIVIPEIEGIIVGKNGKYGVANSIGKLIIPCVFDKIYSITNEGKDEFYVESGNRSMKLTKYLEENKINVEGNNQQNNTVNTTNNTNTVNTNNTANITNTANAVNTTNAINNTATQNATNTVNNANTTNRNNTANTSGTDNNTVTNNTAR